jgi:hypothetical protein
MPGVLVFGVPPIPGVPVLGVLPMPGVPVLGVPPIPGVPVFGVGIFSIEVNSTSMWMSTLSNCALYLEARFRCAQC